MSSNKETKTNSGKSNDDSNNRVTLAYKKFKNDLAISEMHMWDPIVERHNNYMIKVKVSVDGGDIERKKFYISGSADDGVAMPHDVGCYATEGTTLNNNGIKTCDEVA